MNDTDRKLLTEWLGEEYHDYTLSESGKSLSRCSCGLTGFSVREICVKENRTYATPDDMMACKDRLVELGLWREFLKYCFYSTKDYRNRVEFEDYSTGKIIHGYEDGFFNWLMEPERFCQLCADFLKERNDEPGRN